MLESNDSTYSNHEYYTATRALGKIGSSRAIEFLSQAIEDPREQGPCGLAIHCLGELKEKSIKVLDKLYRTYENKIYSSYKTDIFYAVTAISPPNGKGWDIATDFLIDIENHEYPDEEVMVLYHMLFNGGEITNDAENKFEHFLKSNNEGVVSWSKNALDYIKHKREQA